jgi:hypothetical protein
MRETHLIDIHILKSQAEKSEHGESYTVLERTRHYRVGVGARLGPSSQPSYFLEVVVHLCPSTFEVDTAVLEKSLAFLKDLQARSYSLSCEDDGCVSCEINVSPDNLSSEYEAVKSVIRKIF